MFHYGAKAIQIREMNLDDIFLLRLNLLLRMAMDFLKGFALSRLRRQAMWANACHIETESVALGRLNKCQQTDMKVKSSIFIDDYFYQCANELAVMIKLIVQGDLLDDRQKSALQENCEAIASIQRTSYYAKLFPSFANSVVSRNAQRQEPLTSDVAINQNPDFVHPTVGLRT